IPVLRLSAAAPARAHARGVRVRQHVRADGRRDRIGGRRCGWGGLGLAPRPTVRQTRSETDGGEMTGKTIRLNRLFDARPGRSITVAVDHGIGGVPAGLERPREAIAAVLEGEPDGLILTPGMLKGCADLFGGRGRPVLFAAADVAPGSTFPGGPGGGEEYRL